MSTNMDRRGFIKGSLVLGAAGTVAALGASLAGCAAAPNGAEQHAGGNGGFSYPAGTTASDFEQSSAIAEPITEFADEKTYDIVVVGAGTSGLPAVLTALEEGATVACLQKESTPISQGNGSSGVILDETTDLGLLRWIQGYREACSYRVNLDLVRFFAEHSGETAMWMARMGKEAGYPPYESKLTRTETADGSHVTTMRNAFGVKPENNGNLVKALAEHSASKGAEFFYRTPGVQLVKDGERVTAVIGDGEEGYIKFNATKAVILATGDYQNNDSMLSKYAPDLVRFTKKQMNKTGDGMLMAMGVGATMTPVGHSKQMHDMDAAPMAMTGIPFLAVNEEGERFMNEEIPMHYWDETLRFQNAEDPGKFCRIFDNAYFETAKAWGYSPSSVELMENYIPGAVENPKGVVKDLIDTHRCDTLDELADELGIPADALKKTVERYNQLCETGIDEDFGKQSKYLAPIAEPPFWGIHQWIRLTAMGGGIRVNENYQVVDEGGTPIPGLYSVGFNAGDICGDVDWSLYLGGMSCGSCMTSGRYATIHALTGGLVPSKPSDDWEAFRAEFVDIA